MSDERTFSEIKDAAPADRVNPHKGIVKYLPVRPREIDRRDAKEDHDPQDSGKVDVLDFNIVGDDYEPSVHVPFSKLTPQQRAAVIGGAMADETANVRVREVLAKVGQTPVAAPVASPQAASAFVPQGQAFSTALSRTPFGDPMLDRDQPVPPSVSVIFHHPIGDLASLYHDVRQLNGVWLVFYDTRYTGGQQFLPKVNETLRVSIPQLQIVNLPVYVSTVLASFGKLEMFMLVYDHATAEQEAQDGDREAGRDSARTNPF